MNAFSKIWLKRSLSVERSMTLTKQRTPSHLEVQEVNNLRCGRGLDSYVEGAFLKLTGFLTLLPSVLKVKSSYHQVSGVELFPYTKIIWGKAQKSTWIPENLSSSQRLYSLNQF